MFTKNFTISSIIFIFTWLLLVIYSVEFRNNSIIYWFLIISLLLLILLQINFKNLKQKEINFTYLEIVLLFIGLKMPIMSLVGFNGVYGLDTNYEIYYIDQILTFGKWAVTSADSVNSYPLIHIVGSAFSMLANIKIYKITSFMMLVMDLVCLTLFIITSKYVFKEQKVSIYSSLGFIFIYLFVFFAFGRMLTSVLLFLLIVYLMARFPSNIFSKTLIIISSVLLVFSHPIAPLMLMLFVITLLLLDILNNKDITTKFFKNLKLDSLFQIKSNFLLILVVLILAYFIYIALYEQAKFVTTLKMLTGLETIQEIGTASQTPFNWRIFLYGQGLLAVIYGLIFIKYRNNVENSAALLFMSFGTLVGILSVVNYVLGLDLIRYTIFMWPAILLSSNYVLLKSNKTKVLSVLLVLFVVVNLSGYFIYTYDETYDRPLGQWRMHITEQEETSLLTMNISSSRMVSNHYFFMVTKKYSLKNIVIINPKYYLETYKKNSSVNYFFVEKEDLNNSFMRGHDPFKIPWDVYQSYFETSQLAEIYDNGDVIVFKVK